MGTGRGAALAGVCSGPVTWLRPSRGASMADEFTLRIQLPQPQELPNPEGANYFNFTVVGPDVQLLVGYIDFRVIHEGRLSKEGVAAVPMISHRFLVSQTGFQHLRAQMDEITTKYDALMKQGKAGGNA